MGCFDAPIRCGYVGTVMKISSIVVVVYSLSHVRLFVTPQTAAHQTPLFMGSCRQEYRSGLPFTNKLLKKKKKIFRPSSGITQSPYMEISLVPNSLIKTSCLTVFIVLYYKNLVLINVTKKKKKKKGGFSNLKGLRNPMIKEVAVLISLVEAFPRDVIILMNIMNLQEVKLAHHHLPNTM